MFNIEKCAQAESEDAPLKEWIVHPLKENWKKSTCLILFLLSFCIAIYLAFQTSFYVILSAVVLFGSLKAFFLPVKYALYSDKVTIHSFFSKRSKPWTAFHSYYVDKNGILLSPFETPSRLENFRGVYIRFGNIDKMEIIDFIKQRMGEGAKRQEGHTHQLKAE